MQALFPAGVQAQQKDERPVLHIRQFATDLQLTARPTQLVLLDEASLNFDGPEIRYFLEAGTHEFCLQGSGSAFTGFILKGAGGREILRAEGNPRCAKAMVERGRYKLFIAQSPTAALDPDHVGAVEVDPFNPPLGDNSTGNATAGGFWALQLDSSLDPQHRDGTLRAHPPVITDPQRLYSPALGFLPLVADFTSTQIDQYSLFQFLPGPSGQWLSYFPGGATISDIVSNNMANYGVVAVDNGPCYQIRCDPLIRAFYDRGHYQFSIGFGAYPVGFTNTSYSPLTLTLARQIATFTAVYRYFPDGKVGALQPGEVALYESCNYQGAAIVIGAATPDLQKWNGSVVPLHAIGASVLLGNNTSAVFFSEANYAGQASTLTGNTACSANAGTIASIQLQSSTAILLSTNSCPNCLLNNVNLGGQKLSGANLSGAQLKGAILTSAQLNQADLKGADLTGATFSCTNLSGTKTNPLDLSQTTLADLKLVPQAGCRTNLSYTLLPAGSLPPAAVSGWNLTGAVLTGLKNNPLSSPAHPLDLSGAMLTGASLENVILDDSIGWSAAAATAIRMNGASLQSAKMQNADLTTAVMQGANLSGVSLNHTLLKNANLSSSQAYGATRLYGANLDSANLDGATLQGAFLNYQSGGQSATLVGAFLRNVNLSSAQLSGADFTNASFYGTKPAGTAKCGVLATGFTDHCATASGATLNNTNFNSAYLFGVDFSGSNTTIQGVQFGNAVLAGATFSQAHISVDPNIGTNSGFSGAFLQGTDLGDATTLVGTSLFQAFLDFRPNGNIVYLNLSGTHTTFPGYWNTPGAPVCAEMHYNLPTSVPANNTTITCPNGNLGACGPANADPGSANPNWKSGVDISSFASYQFNSTYVPAKTPPVCMADFRWNFGGS